MTKKPAPVFVVEVQEWELLTLIRSLRASAAFFERSSDLYTGEVNILSGLARKLEEVKRGEGPGN